MMRFFIIRYKIAGKVESRKWLAKSAGEAVLEWRRAGNMQGELISVQAK